MPTFMFVLVILALLFALVWFFLTASPALIAGIIRVAGGVGGLVIAFMLLARGRIEIAVPIALLSIGLLSGRGFNIFSIFGRQKKQKDAGKPTGNFSEVKTRYLDMRLDHDTGEMDGWVLKGPFAGQQLSRLSVTDIIGLRSECRENDQQSVALLEAYLDAVQPKWRDHADVKSENGSGETAEPRNREMSIDEAYDILGLQRGATELEIRQAHRNLMKKFHPDQGGSTYLAAKINEAKDLLLKKRTV